MARIDIKFCSFRNPRELTQKWFIKLSILPQDSSNLTQICKSNDFLSSNQRYFHNQFVLPLVASSLMTTIIILTLSFSSSDDVWSILSVLFLLSKSFKRFSLSFTASDACCDTIDVLLLFANEFCCALYFLEYPESKRGEEYGKEEMENCSSFKSNLYINNNYYSYCKCEWSTGCENKFQPTLVACTHKKAERTSQFPKSSTWLHLY